MDCLVVKIFMGCDFSDGKYWFARNGKSDNLSQPLFLPSNMYYFRPTEANPMTMKVFKTALFEQLAPAVKTAQKFVLVDFKDFNFLHVHGALGEHINRAKPGAKIPILKYECFLLSENHLFNSVGETMEIVIIPASTKSHSTRAVGGSSSLPEPVIRRLYCRAIEFV